MMDLAPVATSDTTLDVIFRRLFENEFATLDAIAISRRTGGGMEYIDESVALGRMLGIDGAASVGSEPSDPDAYLLHQRWYAASSDVEYVVSGWSRHLRALLAEEMALPACTSMMRKRGVTDLGEHLVDPSGLVGSELDGTIERARETAARNDMAHMLIVASNGMVAVAAPAPFEAMAHWHNVEFAARVACMRIEEMAVHRSAVPAASG